MKRITVAIFIFLSLPSVLNASRVITVEELVSIKNLTHPVISSRAEQVAFQVRIADLEKSQYQQDIYLLDLVDRQSTPILFTSQDEKQPEFSPDGNFIAFLSTRSEKKKELGDKEVFNLWLLPTSGGEAKKITDLDQSIIDFRWSGDSRYLYYLVPQAESTHRSMLKKIDKKRKTDFSEADKYRLKKEFKRYSLERNESQLLFRGDPGIKEFDLSPDGKYIVYSSNGDGDPDCWINFKLYLLNVADSSARILANLGDEENKPRFSPDGSAVAYIVPQDSNCCFSQNEVYLVNLKNRSVVNITADIDLGIEDFCWRQDSRNIIVNAAAGTHSALYNINTLSQEISIVLTGDYVISALSCRRDSLVVIFETESSPPEIGLISLDKQQLFRLSELNKLDREIIRPKQEVVSYISADGTEIEAVMLYPVEYNPAQKYPAVICVHGGPASRVLDAFWYRLHQTLAANGYFVLAPNYRGSKGYHAEFNVANINDLGGGDYQDILAGLAYLFSTGSVDAGRVGITGASYGGYMTNWAITQSNRFTAAVSRYGIFNLFTDYGGSIYAYWERQYLGNYWDSDSLYLTRSPFKYVANVNTPVLIIHGDDDLNTGVTNSLEMYRALKDQGKDVKLVRFPREGHGFDEPAHRITVLDQVVTFFDQHLKPTRAFAFPGEISVRKSGQITFLKATTVSQRNAPPPEGKYVVVEIEVSGSGTKKLKIDFYSEVMLISEKYDRYLPVGLVVQDQVLQGASLTLGRKAFQARLLFDLPVNLDIAYLRVRGFDSFRIRL